MEKSTAILKLEKFIKVQVVYARRSYRIYFKGSVLYVNGNTTDLYTIKDGIITHIIYAVNQKFRRLC
jgi:hypothetical protein